MYLFTRINKTLIEEGILSLINKATGNMIRFLYIPYCMNRNRKIKTDNIDELINYSFNNFYGLIRPYQFKSEISKLLNILKKKDVKTILEIGTINGGSLFLLSRIANKDAKIISVDLPYGKYGAGYPKYKTSLYKSFSKPSQEINLIRKDSHDIETLKEVKKILNGNKIDFLFIDGDHTYEGVKKDFEMYLPLVSKDGIIAFHDIVKNTLDYGVGVEKFWQEIKKEYKHSEIVENHDQGYAGIGVLYLNGGN